ncbi:MAG: PDZ domain-containing protein, partial [Fimbriimonas sp.]
MSAVSCVLALASPGHQLGDAERAAWLRIAPSIASIVAANGQTRGSVVLIDENGLFLAHQDVVTANNLTGQLSDGRRIRLALVASDSISQMVLLQAQPWTVGPRPLRVASNDIPRGTALISSYGFSASRAEYVTGTRMAVVNTRFLPSSELRFESAQASLTGTVLLTTDGQIAGLLGAALERVDASPTQFGARSLLQSPTIAIPVPQRYQIGPAQMTVAYSVGTEVLQRVVAGFLSTDRQVLYPALGVQCLDNPGGGALIQTVFAKSPAAKVGLQAGDILLEIGGSQVRNSVDFGRVMFGQRPGTKVMLRLQRGGATVLQEVIIGAMKG